MRFSRTLRAAGQARPRNMVGSGKVSVLGIPIDLGGNHRGVDMGPSAFRVADLDAQIATLGYEVEDLGNVSVPAQHSIGAALLPKARYVREIAAVCEDVARRVREVMARDRFPICLGGDHSAAVGSVSGTAAHCAAHGERIGMV